jgi:DNA-binding XRE family transcriptional regulator
MGINRFSVQSMAFDKRKKSHKPKAKPPIGIAMEKIRRKLDLSHQECADLVGLSRVVLTQVETGLVKPSLSLALGFIYISPDQECATPFIELMLGWKHKGEPDQPEELIAIRRKYLCGLVGKKLPSTEKK